MRRKECQVKFRLDQDEHEILKRKVEESGLTQQSFIINSIKQAVIAPEEEVLEWKKLNRQFGELVRQIRGMATNVNQMAHVANGTGELPSLKKLNKTENQIYRFRKECDEQWQSIRRLISQQNHMEQ